jgi:hypothetical protein
MSTNSRPKRRHVGFRRGRQIAAFDHLNRSAKHLTVAYGRADITTLCFRFDAGSERRAVAAFALF